MVAGLWCRTVTVTVDPEGVQLVAPVTLLTFLLLGNDSLVVLVTPEAAATVYLTWCFSRLVMVMVAFALQSKPTLLQT